MENGSGSQDGIPDSGFDPTHPFANQAIQAFLSRYYVRRLQVPLDAASDDKEFQYLQMYTGGNMVPTGNPARNADSGSRTGLLLPERLVPHQCNKYDGM